MEQIGPYKILKRLGGGGFGEVWLGESPLRQVAIKVFNPKDENLIAFATSSNTEGLDVLRTRFLNEAKILAQLESNANIVSVYEFGELDDGSPYYTMAYLPRSLTELLGKDVYDAAAVAELPENERPRALPLNDALSYLTQLLSGLSAAHAQGLVHRDIKPSNVMLGDDNQIRLVDFGIAKAPDGQHSTVSQLGMGSRNYMAPEQRESAKHVDARADVFAVGTLAYRMITGRLPTGRFADPNVLVPELSSTISDLIVRCLSEDKVQRPTDGADLAKQFNAASSRQNSVDENATGTWVGDAGESTIRDELKPLRSQIEKVLLEEGEIPEEEHAALRTMAMIVDLGDDELDELIEATTNELQGKLKPIQNLRRAIAAKVATDDVTERDREIFLSMAAQVGWSEKKVESLLKRSEKSEPPKQTELHAEETVEPSAPHQPQAEVKPLVEAEDQKEQPQSQNRSWGVWVLLMLILAGGGYGYSVYIDQQEQEQERIALERAAEQRAKAARLKQQDDEAWRKAESVNTVASYHTYMKEAFSTAPRKLEAKSLIRKLEFAAAEVEEQRRVATIEANEKAEAERQRLAKLESDRKAKLERERLAKLESARKEAAEKLAAQRCDVCPEMVLIPAGSFRMGDLSGGGASDAKPVHRVEVKAFALGKTEVTFAEYDAFARATNRELPSDNGWGRGTHPVINVSWNDATAYVEWLSKKTGKSYRLPGESEWEYAARAGSTTKYSFGNSERELCRYANHADTSTDYDWRNESCSDGVGKQTAPVGSYEMNAFGLHDMDGNVWEWTQDCWNGSYSGAPSDGEAWTRGDCDRRVLRGGSWYNGPGGLRSAIRLRFPASNRFTDNGFRVAQDL